MSFIDSNKMSLPKSTKINVAPLAACFNSTSATYKYYWLLAILQEVEEEKVTIPKRNLFARMIANAWYTVNYFHVSFGKQDLIQTAIAFINSTEPINIDERQDVVYDHLLNSKTPAIVRQLWHFNKNVPHWFLSPWFPGQTQAYIYTQSKNFTHNCLYSLHDDNITINPVWIDYLKMHSGILKDFCYWNLSLFLQSRNPNVPDIPNKLIKPAKRNNLTKQRTKFWDLVINEVGSIQCIYTNNKLTVGNYAVEHFVPYSFVSHDLIWNLIPADTSFNSSKRDKLPRLEKYFDSFYGVQANAIKIMKEKHPRNPFMEDYLTIFPDLDKFSKEAFSERIKPLITIASNNGFTFLP